MAPRDFKDLTRRTVSDKVLHVKHLIVIKIWNMISMKNVLLQCFTNCSI